MASYFKTKKLRFIFIVYWFWLAYVVAALVWWFIALNTQNHQMATYKMEQLQKADLSYYNKVFAVNETERKKTAQYIGEGSIFFLLIIEVGLHDDMLHLY